MSEQAAQNFLKTGQSQDARPQSLPLSAAVRFLVGHMTAGTSIFTVNPSSRGKYKALSGDELFTELRSM